MNTDRTQRSSGTEGLAERLANGWLMMLTVRHLTKAYRAGQVTCARFFFLAAFQATFDGAVDALSELSGAIEPGPQQDGLRDRVAALRNARHIPALPLDDDPAPDLALQTIAPNHLADLEAAYEKVFTLVGPAAGIDPRLLEEFVADDVSFLMDLMAGGCF